MNTQQLVTRIKAEGLPVIKVVEPNEIEDGLIQITPNVWLELRFRESYVALIEDVPGHGIDCNHPAPLDQVLEELKARVLDLTPTE